MMIIKYYEWLKILPGEKHCIYEQCRRDPDAENGVRKARTLDRETAKSLIEAHHLHVVHRNKYGAIWE